MGPWGAIIMGGFGTVFFLFATVPPLGWRTPWLLVPLIVAGGLIVAAIRAIRAGRAQRPPAHIERVIGRATMFEGVAIPAAAMTLANTGHEKLVPSAIALIVGLHFLPIARAAALPRFWWLGGTLIAAALASAALPDPQRGIIAGVGAAAILWLAAAWALRPGTAALSGRFIGTR